MVDIKIHLNIINGTNTRGIIFNQFELVKIIIGYNSFTQDTKYLAIEKIFDLVPNQETIQDDDQSSFLMKDVMEETFLKKIENIENTKNKIKELIIMVILYEKFTLNFKQRALDKLFQKISNNVNFGHDENDNPLIILCYNDNINSTNRLELIKFLVEKTNVNINRISNNNTTAIMYAYQKNFMDVVEYLISMGAILEYKQTDGNIVWIVNILNYELHVQSRSNLLNILIKSHSNKINIVGIAKLD